MIFFVGAGAAWILAYAAWLTREVRNAPLVDEQGRTIHPVSFDDVLITPQGVEIPVAWLASPDDIGEVLATLAEIDLMGVSRA